MNVVVHLCALAISCSLLGGCISAAPTKTHVDTPSPDILDDSHFSRIVISKRVALLRGKEETSGGFVIARDKKYEDVTASSNFGLENEFANVDCIVEGMEEITRKITIIHPNEFWDSLGADVEALSLTSLFAEPNHQNMSALNLDYLVIVYHQIIDASSVAGDNIAVGIYGEEDREIASAVTVDIGRMQIIDAIELEGSHHQVFGHIIIVPLIMIGHPEEEICNMIGKHTAKIISKSQKYNRQPRVAIIIAKDNPYASIKIENDLRR